MTKLRIFISHSAKDQFTTVVRDRLCTELIQHDFIPLLDKEGLQPGDPWRRQLRTWLGLCHGAVILVSNNVFDSSPERPVGSAWVLNESAVLVWRRELNPDFLVIPVMLPGVKFDELNQTPFEPLNLPEIQAVSVSTIDGESASLIVERIIEQLERLRVRLGIDGPLEKLKQSLHEELKNLSDSAIENIAHTLGIDLVPWYRGESVIDAFIYALFNQDVQIIADAIEKLTGYPSQIRKESLIKIRDILMAFWVEPDAVKTITAVIKQPPKQRAVVLKASRPLIATMYVQRACCLYPSWHEVVINNSFDKSSELIEEIVASLREMLQLYDQGIARSDTEVKRFVQKMYSNRPLFVVIPNFIDIELLDELRKEFPTITFFLLQRETLSIDLLRSNYVECLEPEVPFETEQNVVDTYDYIRHFVM